MFPNPTRVSWNGFLFFSEVTATWDSGARVKMVLANFGVQSFGKKKIGVRQRLVSLSGNISFTLLNILKIRSVFSSSDLDIAFP